MAKFKLRTFKAFGDSLFSASLKDRPVAKVHRASFNEVPLNFKRFDNEAACKEAFEMSERPADNPLATKLNARFT